MGNVIDPDERKEAPTFTRAHLEYLDKTFPLPPASQMAKMDVVDVGALVGHEQVINHIRSLLKEP